MPDEGKSVPGSSKWSAIPQAFVDVVGRITPGFAVLMAFALAVLGPRKFWVGVKKCVSECPDSATALLLVVLVAGIASYFTANVVVGAFYFIAGLIDPPWLDKGVRWDLSCLGDDNFSLKYDFIKFERPDAGSRLGKLSAEILQFRVLVAGWLAASLTGVAMQGMKHDPARWWVIGVLLFAAFLASVCMVRTRDFRNRGTDNYFDIIRDRDEVIRRLVDARHDPTDPQSPPGA